MWPSVPPWRRRCFCGLCRSLSDCLRPALVSLLNLPSLGQPWSMVILSFLSGRKKGSFQRSQGCDWLKQVPRCRLWRFISGFCPLDELKHALGSSLARTSFLISLPLWSFGTQICLFQMFLSYLWTWYELIYRLYDHILAGF